MIAMLESVSPAKCLKTGSHLYIQDILIYKLSFIAQAEHVISTAFAQCFHK
ncbi:hypothetical protein EXN66_Car014767 [Channa argus]|uniref:Uncharacterized protein n=1 Tax=Channa argus TaxID=215402 RepID=A0A6G1Q8V4_CHAAH|nr:hypothetical protein EXN66_Car014767 [Channa argus]